MSKETSKLNLANDQMFWKQTKCQVELFNIAHGVYITKLLKEAPNNDPALVNAELDQIGFNMG